MNEYKIGDKVWSISFPILASHYIEYKENNKYWVGQNLPSYSGNILFNSKNDAINNMISELVKIRENPANE